MTNHGTIQLLSETFFIKIIIIIYLVIEVVSVRGPSCIVKKQERELVVKARDTNFYP